MANTSTKKRTIKSKLGPKAASQSDVDLGNKVRLRRIEQHLSQTDLAEVLGVSFQQVQKYERGFNRISASRIPLLAKALKVPNSFFYEDGDMSRDFLSILVGEKRSGVRLLQAFTKIKSETVQNQILLLVEAVAEKQ